MPSARPYIWEPSLDDIERANVTRLMRAHGIGSYGELLERSTAELEWFWDAVVTDLDIRFTTPYERVLDTSGGVPWATWFTGGRVNLADNCLDRWEETTPDRLAVVWEGEDGDVRRLSYAELREVTDRLAGGLTELGVSPGDRVGIYMPMAPETVAATLACAKIGAVYVPIFSGFAADAVATRLADAGATVLLTADGSLRRGAAVPMKEAADAAADLAGCVEHVVVWSRLGRADLPRTDRDVAWDDLLAGQPGRIGSTPLDSEHPLMIAYTSGTTGRPKGAVHVHGGFLVKVAAEAAYQTDLHDGDLLHWATDLGWIMGPWELTGAGALGAGVLLAEGAADHPGPGRLWASAAAHGVTALGVSPSLIRSLLVHGADPVREHDLSSLRVLGSTGEPWDPDAYRWLFDEVGGGRLPIINISGGTEVGAVFLSPSPVLPLKECSLGGPALGMAMDVVGPDGTSLGPNAVGELVCRAPWPAMTRGIWGDPDRYLETYWNRIPDVWVHGDWASVDDDGSWFLHGRSDDTLNVAGKRIGPAEIESVVAGHPSVIESAAVGVGHATKGEVVRCFVVLRPAVEASEKLAEEIGGLVADHVGKPFRPDRVIFVPGLPKTRSAKVVRRAIRATAEGTDPGDLSTVENPEVLQAFEEPPRAQ
jgi:acetyl-CoA synthetase